ncbi:unnamed protein product [Acanthoscelides obtectus]|uniref:Uncharacterized protein n=1 Tax=Acanthoscelides obtectus TaxID=200917 RepID=A0A9P0P038_ACAOB|nr:unnamed protein product [Acanthoscelides obtectus]CAK1631568.1 hypothetical protein AOBTE_LOCUS7010 [Acanthoscelides obtectus]
MFKTTASQSSSQDNIENYNERTEELYRPFFIHPTTCVILAEHILTLMPPERNVILAMNEYAIRDINPTHPDSPDSPTHVIVFCIRLITADVCQPIGGLLIYRDEDQSYLLAECLKAYINDLWKLGLFVMATVSPPFETFKKMFSHIVPVDCSATDSGPLSYSVAPIKEIVHIYDIQFLLIKLQNLLREGDIRFEEKCLDDRRVYRASWSDVRVLSSYSVEYRMLDEIMKQTREVSRRVHVFTHPIYQQLTEAEAKGLLSTEATGTVVLLNCVRSFTRIIEMDVVDVGNFLKTNDWDGLIDILHTMTFQNSKTRTCTKEKKAFSRIVECDSDAKRRLDFSDSGNACDRLADGLEDKLFIDSDKDTVKKAKSKRSKKNTLANEEISPNQTDKKLKVKEASVNNAIVLDSISAVSKCTQSQSDRTCDIDKNNNSDDSITSNETNARDDCEHRKRKTHKKKAKSEGSSEDSLNNFDFVINSPRQFFESMIQCNNVGPEKPIKPNRLGLVDINNLLEDTKDRLESKEINNESSIPNSKDIFSSKSDDETEHCITASCDKVPNILELLSKVDVNECTNSEFKSDTTRSEMLCTVYGVRRSHCLTGLLPVEKNIHNKCHTTLINIHGILAAE